MLYKKNTLFSLLVFAVFLVGCTDSRKFIHYTYQGVTITRINDYPEDYFYYGNFDKQSALPGNYIISKFTGRDGFMQAYLVFNSDQTVEIIPVADDFTKVGDTQALRLNEEIENLDFIHWRKRTSTNMDSIIEVSNAIKLEIKRNKSGHSKVKAKYEKILFDE